MNKKVIKVSKDFSMDVSGRVNADGDFSAEEFRDKHLAPALRDYDEVTVDLDGVYTCGSSFLEETFGGLIRESKLPYEEIQSKLKIISDDDPSYVDEIEIYLEVAHRTALKKTN